MAKSPSWTPTASTSAHTSVSADTSGPTGSCALSMVGSGISRAATSASRIKIDPTGAVQYVPGRPSSATKASTFGTMSTDATPTSTCPTSSMHTTTGAVPMTITWHTPKASYTTKDW